MKPTFIIIDLFCGFGGTTLGFQESGVACKVFACVNHDPKAIKSHHLNNPEVMHFEEDIRRLDLTELVKLTAFYRSLFPYAKLILWASLECTNFSKAKGGQPRNADSRTLADHLDRYVLALNPDYIQIENVVEFMSWGPLDENNKPISKKAGTDWMKWRERLCSYGYRDEWQELNSADFGAYTKRNRLFGCFAKEGLPIVWPLPTHAKVASIDKKKWQPVKHVLDFKDEGISIFNRAKPLSDKTLERIYAGLMKYVANGDEAFISKYYTGKPESRNTSLENPCRHSLIKSESLKHHFIAKYFSGNPNGKIDSVENPVGSITCVDHHSLVQSEFLQHYYGNGFTTSVEESCPTITTKDRAALVKPKYFIHRDFKTPTHSSIDQPAGTLTTVPKMNLVEAEELDAKSFIINPSWGGNPSSVDQPCCVVVARQDKAPLYLAQVKGGEVAIAVFECDTPMSIKIKEFMAGYKIVDIKMRMLKVPELLQIQGFPANYQMVGNQSDQKKFIGNSVVPHVVKAWSLAMHQALNS